jgi:hypothetical protein
MVRKACVYEETIKSGESGRVFFISMPINEILKWRRKQNIKYSQDRYGTCNLFFFL